MRPVDRIEALRAALGPFYAIAKEALLYPEDDEVAFYEVGDFVVTWGDMRRIVEIMEAP
jgi:hypothetical protein